MIDHDKENNIVLFNSPFSSRRMSSTKDEFDDELVFVTLGDGDFTWSLDLGRYLASSEAFCQLNVRLIATGIDNLDDLSRKYRNSSFILRELKRLNKASSESLRVEVKHEVNAIVKPDSPICVTDMGHIVIFNHPHLGTESAELHEKFLSHLFYSVDKFWLLPSGVFQLTLANGQYDRWKCSAAAQLHGMKLIERSQFVPAPLIISNHVYEHRRHQTGKSFATRTSGSSTFTFVRESTVDITTFVEKLRLPWFVIDEDIQQKLQPSFICSYCSKSFREDRSLKKHFASLHSQRKPLSLDGQEDQRTFFCDRCNIDSIERSFATLEALQDHISAKHDAIHGTILPDWVTGKVASLDSIPTKFVGCGTCVICRHIFITPQDKNDHYDSFFPSTDIATLGLLECRFCKRSFRQLRSQLQHENFCSYRLSTLRDSTA
jgi:Domain of unknown function (DUF2431)